MNDAPETRTMAPGIGIAPASLVGGVIGVEARGADADAVGFVAGGAAYDAVSVRADAVVTSAKKSEVLVLMVFSLMLSNDGWFVTTNYLSRHALYGRRVMPRRSKPDALALAVGRRIRALREELGMTQEQLAYTSALGSKGHLSSLEKGLVMPTVATLRALADGLGVHVMDLVNDPRDGDRAKILELTRGLPPGVLRKLVKDLSPPKKK